MTLWPRRPLDNNEMFHQIVLFYFSRVWFGLPVAIECNLLSQSRCWPIDTMFAKYVQSMNIGQILGGPLFIVGIHIVLFQYSIFINYLKFFLGLTKLNVKIIIIIIVKFEKYQLIFLIVYEVPRKKAD